MLTSKQRAFLRKESNGINAIFQVGKSGVTPELTESLNDVLEKREIIKISVLKNCMQDLNEIADIISTRTHSEIVHIIGNKIVFYRQSKKPSIILPKNN